LCFSQDTNPNVKEESKPDTVKIGIYTFSVYDMDFPANQVNLNFYVWYNYKNDSLNPVETFELINAKEFSKTGETLEKYDTIIYRSFRCNSLLKKEWDVTDFPFDEHIIDIIIEDVDKDNSKLVFAPDIIGSTIDRGVKLPGWVIKDFNIKVVDHTYETNYGDPHVPRDEYSSYSRVIASFTIERHGKGLFFKLFIGLFISVLIAVLTFFVNPADLDPRFGLPVGAIFAAIASLYVINSTLPQNATLTLVDVLHDISFIYIFICILISAVSLRFYKSDRIKISNKLDKYSFLAIMISYVVLVVIFVTRSL
ncbi:MAG: hypothetical protein ACRDFC_04005, partial [Ignavibacteria bacterium]